MPTAWMIERFTAGYLCLPWLKSTYLPNGLGFPVCQKVSGPSDASVFLSPSSHTALLIISKAVLLNAPSLPKETPGPYSWLFPDLLRGYCLWCLL